MALLLRGAPVAEAIYEELSNKEAESLSLAVIKHPQLAYSHFITSITEAAKRLGTAMLLVDVESYDELSLNIASFNANDEVDGILLVKPFPTDWDFRAALESLDPNKDVDGLHPVNVGLLAQRRPAVVPAVAQAVARLLAYYNVDVKGKHVVVIGRSEAVGMPLALLLTHLDATVTLAHSKTVGLQDITRRADIVVAAVGQPHLFGAPFFDRHSVVVDVGATLVGGHVLGDVDLEAVEPLVSAISPVPGGVGPLTTACLLSNLFLCASRRK